MLKHWTISDGVNHESHPGELEAIEAAKEMAKRTPGAEVVVYEAMHGFAVKSHVERVPLEQQPPSCASPVTYSSEEK